MFFGGSPFGLAWFGGLFGGRAAADAGPRTLREAVYARLASTTALTAIVGDRIHPGGFPQSQAYPAVSFQVDLRGGSNLSGSDGTADGTVRVDAWSRDPDEADRMAEAVRRRWHGFQGRIGSVEVLAAFVGVQVDLSERPETADDAWLFRVSSPLTVRHRVPKPDQLQE